MLRTLLACERRLWLEQRSGRPRPPRDEHGLVLRERSQALERAVVARLPAVEGPVLREGTSFAEAADETRRRLVPGGPALLRPAFLSRDGRLQSTPALVRWDGDTLVVTEMRLALRPAGRRDLALQMAHHVALIGETLGPVPVRCEVVNGVGEVLPAPPEPTERWRESVDRALALLGPEPEPGVLHGHSFCQSCSFYDHCWDDAEARRLVDVLPELPRAGAALLHERGVHTFDALAALAPGALADTPMEKDAARTIAQAKAHATAGPVWLRRPELPRGRALAWLDLEGDAMGEASDVPIYLWGVAVEPPGATEAPEPESLFADLEPGGDRRGWERFVTRAQALLAAHADVLWVHWHDSEPLWIRRYLKRYGAPAPLEQHWRSSASFVDLHRVLDRSVRLPLRSYSVKWVAPFAGFAWRNPEAGSEWSVAQFHRARESRDAAERERLLAAIAEYNADDLLAMRAVWRWLDAHGPAAPHA